MIETLVLSLAFLAALSALGALLYFGFVHMSLNYLMHEYLICQNTKGASDCRREFQFRARPVLFAGRILVFENTLFGQKNQVRLVLQMPLNCTMTLKKDLRVYR